MQVIVIAAKIAGVLQVTWFTVSLPIIIGFLFFATMFLYKLKHDRR